MALVGFWFCSVLLFYQDPAPQTQEPPPPVIVGDEMPKARNAFLAGDYAATANILQPLIQDNQGEAMLLAADAYFALDTPRSLKRAINLYERCLYEDNTIPFPDHSYHQLAEIYLQEAERQRSMGRRYEAREMASEAEFYMSRLLKKYPNSFYRDTTLNRMLDLSLTRNEYEKTREIADTIWNNAVDGRLLTRVEPIIFIHQEPFQESLASIEEVYQRHASFIHITRDLLLAFATRFEEAGDLGRARDMYLLVYNLWPKWGDSASSLGRLADLHRRQKQFPEAAFLYKLIMLENPNTPAEARAWLGVAEMMERGQVHELELNDALSLSYRDLVDRIRLSSLPDDIRARYHYKLALYESLYDVEKSLVILRNLLDEYEKGPYLGLYRQFYEKLLFTTIDSYYDRENDWALDRIYRQHHKFLAFTTQTPYPHKIAKAYIRLNLPNSAQQVYENMWNYKDSISGFDLAFQEPLNDYLLMLDTLRQDDRLRLRLRDYEAIYRPTDRFHHRFLFVKTMYQSRTMEPAEFLKVIEGLPRKINTIYDARRMRRMALFAQEQEAWELADQLYAQALQWPELGQRLPRLQQEALLFQADRLFSIGNYYEAERRFQRILTDNTYDDHDRDWAYLQLARLHELKGEEKTSLRIYGQLAYAEDDDSKPLAAYAKQRLFALASIKKLKQKQEEMGLDF